MDKEKIPVVLNYLLLVLIVAIVGLFLFVLGLMIGYGVIGDGDNILSVLSPSKWQDLISKFTGQ